MASRGSAFSSGRGSGGGAGPPRASSQLTPVTTRTSWPRCCNAVASEAAGKACPGAGPATTAIFKGVRPSGGEDELAEDVAAFEQRHRLARLRQRPHVGDQRANTLLTDQPHQRVQLVPGAHGGADDRQLEEEHPVEI